MKTTYLANNRGVPNKPTKYKPTKYSPTELLIYPGKKIISDIEKTRCERDSIPRPKCASATALHLAEVRWGLTFAKV